jgi:hypothetical protein
MLLDFTFRSAAYFKLIFVYCASNGGNLYFCAHRYSFVTEPFVENSYCNFVKSH